jgi:hypothetical protein
LMVLFLLLLSLLLLCVCKWLSWKTLQTLSSKYITIPQIIIHVSLTYFCLFTPDLVSSFYFSFFHTFCCCFHVAMICHVREKWNLWEFFLQRIIKNISCEKLHF